MIFAPMQTGAGGLRPGWGRRVTDRLSSSATRAFPPHPGLGASSEVGGRGLTATPESPPGGRLSRGSGRCPCGAAGSGQQTSRPAAQGAGRRGWEPRAAHLSAPLSTSPSTAAPTYADISFIASCVSLQRVSFALGSCSCPLFLPLSTSLCSSLAARLLAHFPTHYGRGIQPSSENTTKPALFMTIQRGRRQYGAASQAASRPLRPRPRSRGPALDHAPSRELRAPAREV